MLLCRPAIVNAGRPVPVGARKVLRAFGLLCLVVQVVNLNFEPDDCILKRADFLAVVVTIVSCFLPVTL